MADKYWWEKLEKQSNDSAESNSNQSGGQGYWWENGTISNTVGKNVVDRVNNWINSHNSYIGAYQNRYADRKYNYEDAYVSDSSSWLDIAKNRKSQLESGANDILSYMDQYKDYLDAEWMQSVRDTLTSSRDAYGQIVDTATKDNEYWSGFGSEDLVNEYGSAEEAYKAHVNAYNKRNDQLKLDTEAYAQEIEDLGNFYDEAFTIQNWYGDYELGLTKNNWDYDPAEDERKLGIYNRLMNEYGGNLDAVYTEYKKKERYLAEAKQVQKDAKDQEEHDLKNAPYLALDKNADFAEKSAYKSTQRGDPKTSQRFGANGAMYTVVTDTGFDDILYDYINGNETARTIMSINDIANGSALSGFDKSYLKEMKDEEIRRYNYLYDPNDKTASEEYLAFLLSDLTYRQRKRQQEEWAGYAKEHPIKASVDSVLISPLKGLSALGQVVDYADDGTIDQNAGYNKFSYIPSAIRGQVSKDIAKPQNGVWGEVGSWTYQLGMSMGDFLMNSAVSGGNSMISLTLMGSGAMADTVISAKDRGLSDDQAMTLGVVAGAAEIITEKLSLDALFNGDLSKGAMRYILTNALTEGTEEVGSSLINLAADVLVSKDKSEWEMAIKDYLEKNPDATEREAFQKVLEDNMLSLGLDFLGGTLMGGVMGSGGATINYFTEAAPYLKKNKDAIKEHGESANELIKEGLANDPNSKSYDLAQYYAEKTSKGKKLSGYEIRNLLAANQEQITPNDLKKIQKAAENRLKELGQTEDVEKLAELATKYVTGQKMSKAEKAFLANNKNGNRVAQEALPDNILSGDYTSEWAEGIGTKQVNKLAYNIKAIVAEMAKMNNSATYKSLEERVSADEKLGVSESGKAVEHSTGNAIDLSKVEVVDFVKDKETGEIKDMTLNVDGKEVKASEIDYADNDQSYLFTAVKHIENITPGDATVFIRGYKPNSGQTVGEYLNGIDEAFTYGYHRYSEADMGAGLFTPKVSKEQAKGAYLLGQTTRNKSDTNKSEAIKRMRTAMEAEAEKATAEGKEAPKSKKLTITYNNGNGEIKAFKKAGMELTDKQNAAVDIAKILHKLGLGTNFEFFSSRLSKTLKDKEGNPARVFINDQGVEEMAPAGVYRLSDGTIRIDLNAYNGRGLALYSLAHELTHFIQQWSDTKYKVLADFLVKTYEKTDMTMHQRVLAEQKRLSDIRGKEISYNEAYDEVVAKAMMKMFDDGRLVQRLTELKAKDKKLAHKLWEGVKKFLAEFFGIYNSNDVLYKDSDDLVQMRDAFEQLQDLFAEALVEASDNFQTAITAAENQTLVEAGFGFDETTRSMYSLDFSTAYKDTVQVGKKSFDTEAIVQIVAKGTGRSIEDARKWVQSEMTIANIIMQNPEFLDFEADNRYEAIKKNSDYPQGTVDLSNLCPKREEFTAMFDMLQKKYPDKLFTAKDVAEMRKILSENGITVACGACFVEDRRQLIGEIADTFIQMWKEAVDSGKPLQKTNAAGQKSDLLVTKALAKQYGLTPGAKIMATDTYIPNQYDLTTYEGFKLLEKNHPTIAMGFNRYNNSRGQQSARLIEGRAEYNRQILGWSDAKVRSVNNNGGLRIFSFSDFEVVHLLDLVQVIIDCAAKGVKIQGYTKIPAFAKLVRNTGVKLNRSHIPKGDYGYHMENGKVVLDQDTTEGIDTNDKNFMDESDNPNVGDVIIGINPTQIGAAMLDPFFDYIIPFHSNKAKEILRKLGTGEWVNYKESQHEKDISTGKASAKNVNIYTDVINKYHPTNKVEFVEAFLKECKRQGKIPRYAEFLNVDANGDYAYREGYHKLLVDFKMFDKDGNILPQGNITPNLDENFMKELLNAEIDRKQNYEFPQAVYDAIDKKFGEQYSSQETDAEGYDTRNLEWAIESGVINDSDQARFWEAIAEIQKLGYNSFARTKNGAYIIETANTMMFTDGDYKAPTLSKVIVFPYGEYVETAEERAMIRNEARTTGRTNQSTEIIEKLYGPGFVTEYYTPHYRSDGREIARGKGTHSSGTASQSGGRGVRHGETDGLQSGQKVNRDFLADDKLKGNYTVSEISEMFDAWNSDPELADLSKKVFSKLQEIQDNLSRPSSYPGLGTWPYDIRFKSEAYMHKEFYDTPHGVFVERSNDKNYGITYNLDYFKSVSDQEKAHVLLHEAIHACTVGAIASAERRIPNYSPNRYTLDITPDDSWGEAQKAGLELIQVFNQVRVANKGNEYGQKSVHEMVAEMSNPEFRAMLKKQSLWGTIVDAIKRIFGIVQRTAYDAVSDALEKILELNMNKKTGEVYSSQETDLDSMGKQLGEDQVEYFVKSAARDSKGRLQVVYHGGTVEYEFDTTRGGKGATQYGPGAYFTDSEYYAKEYTWMRGGNVRPYYLNIEKMFDDTNMGATTQMPEWNKLVEILRKNGIEEKFIKRFADDGFAYMSRYLAIKAGAKTSSSWEGSEQLNAMLREAGFDGIKGYLNDVSQYVIFTPNQAKLTTNEVPSSFYDVRYSTQETDNISNRELLANAFEGLVQNSEEYKLIQEYKGHIKILNEYQEKLDKLNAEIRDITFGNGERDFKKLKELQTKAKNLAKEINRHDKKLVSLEASEPLRKVIEQERKKEAQKTKAHVKELLQNKKARAEQTELRHKIRKTVRDLDKILNRGNKKQNVKEDMKGFVSKALDLADYIFTDHISNDELIRRGITVPMRGNEAQLVKETEEILSRLYDEADSLTDEEFTKLDAKRKSNLAKLRDLLTEQRNARLSTPVYQLFDDLVSEYASLKNSKQDAVKAAYNEELEKSLRSFMSDDDRVKILKNMRVADMTTEELNWLYRAYTMVLTNVRDANKFHVKGMTETIDQKVSRIMTDFGSRKAPDGKVAIIARNIANKIGWDYEKLYYALDRIGSEAFTELIMNIANSENIVMEDIIEAVAFRDKMVENYGFNNWDVNKKIDREFLDNTGKKFTMTLGQLMSLYAYSRREGAWDHIEYGGFVFGEKALTDPRPADSYKLSKAQCEAITSLLTKEQKDYVEAMQKFLSETMGEKGNEVSMMLYGIKMFGDKNYFPIHIAGQYKAQAQESQAKSAAGFSSMSNAGFTHAQNPNAKAPFVLEGFNEVWSDHVNEMSRYHGTVPALEDLRRVMNRSSYSDAYMESMSVKAVMENSFGKEAVDYFDNLYREANSGAIRDKLQEKSHKLLSLFRKNSVAYSLSVLIQQPASLVRAFNLIDRKYFGFKGFGTITSGVVKAISDKWTKAHTNAYNEMLKYAPGVTMAKEIGGFDTATGGSIRSYLLDTNKSLKQKWKTETAAGKGKAVLDLVDNNAIANLPNLADKIAWIEIWNACKRETVATHKDLATNSEEFMKAVGDRFTEVIRATQVYDSIFAKSPMLKSKNLAVQYLVSFMNEPNTIANMAEKAVRDVTKGNWKSGAKTAHVLIHSIIFTNLLKSIIYAMRDDDEDETYIEKYIEAVVGNMMDDFNALNYIPLVRDVWSVAQGYDVERADMAIVADAVDALNKVIKTASTDKDGMTEEELIELDKKMTEANWKLVESVASFFGIPVKNIRREIDGVFDHVKIASANAGQTTLLSAWDKVYDAVMGSIPFVTNKETKSDKLYDAIISGDQAYIARLKSTYKTDDAYQTAVRKALRENDSRIHDAAQARYEGRTEEYKRIFREIQKEGKFSFDDIMSAINSEESKIRNGVEPEKATSSYGTGDFVEAIVLGDTANAKAIREEIISTKVANGKSEKEAEKEFASAVATSIGDAYASGLLDEAGAKNMLMEYADKDEEEAASKVSYWTFCVDNPEYDDFSEANVNDYYEFAEPANIPLDVFAQYINGTKGLETKKDKWGDVEVTKREQVLEVIDSLPLTWQQKDALYLAAGYSESKIWDVPW